MLISHMSEDDETHFYGLSVRPLALKGLRIAENLSQIIHQSLTKYERITANQL